MLLAVGYKSYIFKKNGEKIMNNKSIGIILFIVSILLISTTILIKSREDRMIDQIITEQGSCFLDDGTCLHKDKDITLYILVWVFSAILIALSLFLFLFEKSQKEIVSVLNKQKQVQDQENKFEILLKGLDEYEKKVIKAVKEQDGIEQSTLRLRTDLHKSKLSIVLDNLEKKGLVSRKAKGKTKKVFLKVNL